MPDAPNREGKEYRGKDHPIPALASDRGIFTPESQSFGSETGERRARNLSYQQGSGGLDVKEAGVKT